MEKYEIARDNASKYISLADHILTMTYPIAQDPKLLKFVMKNISQSLNNAILMIMHFERTYKRVPPFTENHSVMISYLPNIFKRYNLSSNYIPFLNEVNEIMNKQKKSEVEFIRKDKFVFASKDYDLDVISEKDIKEYLVKTKLFVKQITEVVEKNERKHGKR